MHSRPPSPGAAARIRVQPARGQHQRTRHRALRLRPDGGDPRGRDRLSGPRGGHPSLRSSRPTGSTARRTCSAHDRRHPPHRVGAAGLSRCGCRHVRPHWDFQARPTLARLLARVSGAGVRGADPAVPAGAGTVGRVVPAAPRRDGDPLADADRGPAAVRHGKHRVGTPGAGSADVRWLGAPTDRRGGHHVSLVCVLSTSGDA